MCVGRSASRTLEPVWNQSGASLQLSVLSLSNWCLRETSAGRPFGPMQLYLNSDSYTSVFTPTEKVQVMGGWEEKEQRE